MTRDIDLDDLKPEDREYINQRPWIKDEIKLVHGLNFEDLDFGDDKPNDEPNEDLENEGEPGPDTNEEDAGTESDSTGEETEDNYEEWEYSELQDEVKRRNDEREGTELEPIKPSGRSAQAYVTALREDDASE